MCAKHSKAAPAAPAAAAAKPAAPRQPKHAAAASTSGSTQPAAGPSRPAAAKRVPPAAAAAVPSSESEEDSDDSSDASSDASSSSAAGGGGDDLLQRTALSLAAHPLPAIKMLSRTLARFTQLARLDLSDMQPSPDAPRGLVDLEWLAAATGAAQAKRRAPDEEHFGRRLTWLSVANNEGLGGEGALNGIETLRNLYVLNATGCALKQLPAALLPQSLRALILNSNALSSIPPLPHMPELNTLALSHNGLTSLPASLCASLPQLKKISLSQNALTCAALPDLSPLSHLREVRLAGNKLGRLPAHLRTWGKGVGSAARGTGLETLELGDCGLERWEDIAPLLEKDSEAAEQDGKRSKGLKNLTLKGNGVALLDGYRERIIAAHPSLLVLDGVVLQPRAPKRPQANAPQPAATERDGAEAGPSRRERGGAQPRGDAASRRQDRAGPPPQEDGGERRRRDRAGPPPDEDGSASRRRERAGPPPGAAQERRRDRAGPAPGSSGRRDRGKDDGAAKAMPSKRVSDAAGSEAALEERSRVHKRGGRGKKHHAEEPAAKPAPAAPVPPPVEGVFEDEEKRSSKKRAKRGRKDAEEATVLQEGGDDDAADQAPRKKRKEDRPKKPKITAPAWDADSPLVAAPAAVPEPEPEATNTSVAAVIEVRKKGGKKGLPPAPRTGLPAWSVDPAPWGAGDGGDAWGAGESAW